MLGALLADLAVEHHQWVAGGDQANPDSSTTMARFHAFLHRLHVLFTEGLIMRIPDTYTGAMLQFLNENSVYHVGRRVQTIGLGDMGDASVQGVVRGTLRRAQQAVANVIELGKVCMSKTSWIHAFEAFALPCEQAERSTT